MTAHAKYDTACTCTIEERFDRPWQPLKGISNKKYMFANCPTLSLQKYINLKGLHNKIFPCMLCHWHRMHDIWVRKYFISRRILSGIQKGFSLWIMATVGFVWWKKRSKISWHFPLNVEFAICNCPCLYILKIQTLFKMNQKNQKEYYGTIV
jgi:hypothetical protein